MTIALVLQFPLGRFHATPWGRHVKEGAIELPPSPWRLLRALYAVWRTRLPALDERTMRSLFDALAVPATIYVPRHRISPRRRTGDEHDLVAFAEFDPGAELAVEWRGVTLSEEQFAALAAIAGSMLYFGRADNFCEARIESTWQPSAHNQWLPLDMADYIPREVGKTLTAPERPLNLESLDPQPPEEVRKGNQPFPAGTKLVAYQRIGAAPQTRRRVRQPNGTRVRAVRFDIAQGVLPPKADALIYTDVLRSAALSHLGKYRPEREHTLLGGKTAQSQKATDNHDHAHYLPLFDTHSLTGLLVWVPAGLADDELAAVLDIHTLWNKRTRRTSVRVAGAGELEHVAPELCGSSRTWSSVTPFAPSMRHFKKSWDLRRIMHIGVTRELRYRGHEDVSVEVEVRDSGQGFSQNRPTRACRNKPAAMVRLRLDRPTSGPLALGHLSHFGLGLFAPQ